MNFRKWLPFSTDYIVREMKTLEQYNIVSIAINKKETFHLAYPLLIQNQ